MQQVIRTLTMAELEALDAKVRAEDAVLFDLGRRRSPAPTEHRAGNCFGLELGHYAFVDRRHLMTP